MDLFYYLKKEWQQGAYDCWGLVREYYELELDIILPRITIDAENMREVLREFKETKIRQDFQLIDQPQHNCVVAFGKSTAALTHVGIYLDLKPLPRVLHNHTNHNVICETIGETMSNYTIAGYYRHKNA